MQGLLRPNGEPRRLMRWPRQGTLRSGSLWCTAVVGATLPAPRLFATQAASHQTFLSVRGGRKVSPGSVLARVTVEMDRMDESVAAQAISQNAGSGLPVSRQDGCAGRHYAWGPVGPWVVAISVRVRCGRDGLGHEPDPSGTYRNRLARRSVA